MDLLKPFFWGYKAIAPRLNKYSEHGAEIIGIGDNGVWTLNRLMKADLNLLKCLVLHRDLRRLGRAKAWRIEMGDESWKGIEKAGVAAFLTLPRSVQRFYDYCDRNLYEERPAFVLADLAENIGRETAPAVAKISNLLGGMGIGVVRMPAQEDYARQKDVVAGKELYERFHALCEYARAVIVLEDTCEDVLQGVPAAKAMEKRQSDFVGDFLRGMQGDDAALLDWKSAGRFLSGYRCFWQAWSSEGADVRAAMAEARQMLARGGALQKTKGVFVMITGKAGLVDLRDVQGAMAELAAAIDEDTEVMLHVNSEKEFGDSVRVNMAVKVELM